MKSITIIFFFSLWLTGCSSGTGEGLDSNGQPSTGQDSSTAAPLAANFKAIQDNVFTPVCIVCHAGAAAPLGLKLDADNSYAFLVGMASSEEPGILRVNPGDPDNSYLIQKLEGTAKVGGQMPLGRSAIPQETIDLIRQWIAEGAEDTAAPVAQQNTPPTIKSITPDNGSTISSLPKEVIAIFSQPVDASSVNSGTISVIRSGGDGTFEDGNEVPLTPQVALSVANPAVASIDLAGIVNESDTYRITFKGTGSNTIMNEMALMLDGNGDGAPGGDFQATFNVTPPPPPINSGEGGASASFQTIQDNVFTPICTVCHAGDAAPQGLKLDASNSYALLVGTKSTEVAELLRVKPGDPNNSYLIQKLEGTASVGSQMPLGGTALPKATIDYIRQWITEGAKATGSITSGGGTAPAPIPPPPPPPKVDPVTPPSPPVGSGEGGASASFQTIQDNVFTPICTVCHAGDAAPQGLKLDASNSYALLVGTKSTEVAELLRVKPGDPNNSYLIQKLEGTASVGSQMPLGGTALPKATIDYIRQWITEGAKATGSITSGGGTAPAPIPPPPPPPKVDPVTPPPPIGSGSAAKSAFKTIQDDVFTPICTICHAGPGAPEGLQLNEANSLPMLVDIPSAQISGLRRIQPGDPDNSYLIQKLEGTAGSGQRMPRGGPYLPQATIDYIRQWISDGAKATDSVAPGGGTAPPPPPPKVEPLEPTWRSIQDKVFTTICTACHIGEDAPEDLRLDEANSYQLLVNADSEEDSSFLRVKPGNAEDSYLIKVLEGTTKKTPRMPFGGPYLPQESIDVIRQWINNGAVQ
jgi:cytochrome c5